MDFHLSERVAVSTRVPYAYILCGWHTHSDVPLSNVPTSVRGGESVNILIRIAPGNSPMAKSLDRSERAFFEHSTERSLIGIEDVADFEVSRGQQISVWPVAGAAKKDIELFLFGPVWATLCHQRGILPLHASAIVTKRGITAFAGASGAGKSTIAALMGSLGYALVTDDILPVSFRQNSVPGAWPYLRRLKLQGDSITELDLTRSEVVSETLDKEKYFVRPNCIANDNWSRLERVYLLENDPTASRIAIDQITGAEAVRTLVDHTYHFNFILDTGRFREHLALCTQLASKIDLYRLRRPGGFGAGNELGAFICAHLKNAPT
jgi:hypothetical protein